MGDLDTSGINLGANGDDSQTRLVNQEVSELDQRGDAHSETVVMASPSSESLALQATDTPKLITC